jgi:hypothetical protein
MMKQLLLRTVHIINLTSSPGHMETYVKDFGLNYSNRNNQKRLVNTYVVNTNKTWNHLYNTESRRMQSTGN